MSRTAAPSCQACERLRTLSSKYSDLRLGLPRSNFYFMRRLYTRAESRTYVGIGWICDRGHVVLDQPHKGQAHVLTQESIVHPPVVICTLNGEEVGTTIPNGSPIIKAMVH